MRAATWKQYLVLHHRLLVGVNHAMQCSHSPIYLTCIACIFAKFPAAMPALLLL